MEFMEIRENLKRGKLFNVEKFKTSCPLCEVGHKHTKQKFLDFDYFADRIVFMIKGNYSKDAQKELRKGLNKLTLTELVLLQKMIKEKDYGINIRTKKND